MIHVELSHEEPWPGDDPRREALAIAAVRAAVTHTPHGELLTLNRQYRGKDKPTNVLSFPMVQPDLIATVTQNSDDGEVLLGDIVVAHGVCVDEAQERGITLDHHLTHLVVHGTLHLLGYDHLTDDEGDAMEEIERRALADLGIADPYLIRED
jgi:probable rRNA maturation factor